MFKTAKHATFSTFALSAILLTAAPAYAAGDDDAPKTEITAEIVTDGIYRLIGPGGNIGVSIGEDGVFVIDDKYERFGEEIIAQIEALSDQPIRYVVNTHYHGDHTGANSVLKTAGATIVAHDNVRARMGMTFENKLWGNTVEATSPNLWPTLTFSENATFHINDQTVHVIHVPGGHTDGDSIVHFQEANVLHMGDNFFNGMFPYVDIDSGGSLQGMIAAQMKAINMIDENTRVIPGHGDMSSRAGLEATRDQLLDIQSRIQASIDEGTALDDILAARPLKDLSSLSAFIDEDKMVRIAYRSLQEK